MTEWRADRIAVIGDLHGYWDLADNRYFAESNFDLLLFVGDLGSGTRRNGVEVIAALSKLTIGGLVLPGNNDAEHLAHLAAEWGHQSGKAELFRIVGSTGRVGVMPCGFSSHLLSTRRGEVTLIAGRPCSMGGSVFSFSEEVSRNFGVSDLEASTVAMKRLIDESSTEALIFVGHNGPFGLGSGEGALWARDFRLPSELEEQAPDDWGDRDLQEAIEYAIRKGKRVDGVIAGHMHRAPHRGATWATERHGTTYINPAVVPRIVGSPEGQMHHFVEVELNPSAELPGERFRAAERWFEDR